MRMRATVTAVAILASVTTGVVSSPTAAAPTPTSADQLQFFNMSARLVRASSYADTRLNWRAGFRRMKEYAHRADVITVLEVPLPKRKRVVGVMERILGVDYGSVHSDSALRVCSNPDLGERRRSKVCGNTLIAFRVARIAKRCDGCGVRRWVAFNEHYDQSCAQRGNATHVMARLQDRAQGKILTMVPVHFHPGLSTPCLALNLKKLNDILESNAAWSNRPMTVVVGDFNEHPDPRYRNDDVREGSWRREERKACWYKRFSLHAGDLGCDYDWSLPYSDTIGLKNGTGTADICSEWTYSNMFPVRSGVRADADECNPEGRQRKRIDHLWVRYETSDGTAIEEPDSAWYNAQIVAARVDRGWYDPPTAPPVKYSDHRMLHALLSWCGAQSAGFTTPCD